MTKKADSDKVKEIIRKTIKESEITPDKLELTEIEETLSMQVSDIRESSLREKNIIIHGAKECKSDDSATRKQRDAEYVKYLTIYFEVEYNVAYVTSIGKRLEIKDDEEPKARPMKVVG